MAEFRLGFANEETVRDISVNRREPPWLLSERLAALARFNELPLETNPLFTKQIDISAARVEEAIPYANPPAEPRSAAMTETGVSGMFHQMEDHVETLGIDVELEEKGVVLDTLEGAARRHPEFLKSFLTAKDCLPRTDKFAQMGRALHMAGIFLHVPDDIVLSKPILLRWSVGRESTALVSRTIVSLGRNSRASVIEETESSVFANGGRHSLFCGTTEAVIGAGSNLRYTSVENAGENVAVFLSRQATMDAGSSTVWGLGHVGGAMTRSRVDNILAGRGASVNEVQVMYGHKTQMFDLLSKTRHAAEDTVSDLLSKSVLQDQAKAYTKGLITIEKEGRGSDSYLGEFGMVLSRDARFLAIPSLEIENHLVKRAKHAASVAQISDEQIFYLTSRGINERAARRLIVMGFLEPVVERIPLESVETRLRGLFETRWAG